MANIIPAKKYELAGAEPSAEIIVQIDDMFRDLFDGLHASPIGNNDGASINFTGSISGATEGDLLYVDSSLDVVGLTAAASGKLLRAAGALTAPTWSTLTMPDTIVSGAFFYASSANTLAALTIPAAGKVLRSTGAVPAYSTFTIPDTFTTGSMPYAAGSNVLAALAVGSAGQIIRSDGTTPAYSTFTIPNTFAQGDIIYGSAANVLTALAKNASATRYLSNTGASNNPAWAQVNLADGVTGVLPVANGGTGTSTELAIRKTADEIVTDTTIQDDNHLTVSLDASSAYYFHFVLFFTNAGAGEGVKFDINGTVGVSSVKAQVSIYDDTLNTLAAFARVEALATSVGAGISSGDNFASIEGTIETSTAGTFLLRFAQNATGASAGVTLEENSSMTLRKLNA